jgi:hypothetical protein
MRLATTCFTEAVAMNDRHTRWYASSMIKRMCGSKFSAPLVYSVIEGIA